MLSKYSPWIAHLRFGIALPLKTSYSLKGLDLLADYIFTVSGYISFIMNVGAS